MKKLLLIAFVIVFVAPQLASSAYGQNELAISEIFSRADDAVVLVAAKDGSAFSTGTGFIVSPDGLIITGYHVVSRGDIFVKLNNKKVYGNIKIVEYNERHDLALLKIDGTGFKTVALGDSNQVRVGEKVIAIGNPMGLESTVSEGIVSSLRRMDGLDLIQITAPVSGGSSGGPVFNMQGKVVGVTASSNVEGQNLNFAIPINYASPILAKAMKCPSPAPSSINGLSRRELPVADDRASYVVRSGDTLSGIAKQFDTTVESIVRLNNLSGTRIYSGQKIRVSSSGLRTP